MYLCTPMNKKILNLAVPSIVSNITVPLLGLVDTAITGHMGDARYIGAIAVGSMIFNVTYWLFGFLRMGTGGLTAQAFGAGNMQEALTTGIRSLMISTIIGVSIIILQTPLLSFAMWFISPEKDIMALSRLYCDICVWGAPATLGLFALNGWFVGMQDTKIPMAVSIMQNIVNIVLSLIFVYVFGMKMEGVAFGTVTAQWFGFLAGLLAMGKTARKTTIPVSVESLFDRTALSRFFSVNRDIFLRTIFLVAVNLYFIAAGAQFGGTILAVNTLLMQLFTLYSFVMDGFAYSAEALCGRYYGAGDSVSLRRAVRLVFLWSLGLTTLYTLAYVFGGQAFLSLLTDDSVVIAASAGFLPWAMAIPFAGIMAFVWDGIFIGMTLTKGMLLGTCVASFIFFATFFSLSPLLGNHSLWLAFILYLVSRGIVQSIYYRVSDSPKSLC